jgi:hypothetical protein
MALPEALATNGDSPTRCQLCGKQYKPRKHVWYRAAGFCSRDCAIVARYIAWVEHESEPDIPAQFGL